MAQNPPGMLRNEGPFCRESPCLPVKAHKPCLYGLPIPISDPDQNSRMRMSLPTTSYAPDAREVHKMENSHRAEDAAFRTAVFIDTAITKKRSGTDPNRL